METKENLPAPAEQDSAVSDLSEGMKRNEAALGRAAQNLDHAKEAVGGVVMTPSDKEAENADPRAFNEELVK